jgi:hypothetical protein
LQLLVHTTTEEEGVRGKILQISNKSDATDPPCFHIAKHHWHPNLVAATGWITPMSCVEVGKMECYPSPYKDFRLRCSEELGRVSYRSKRDHAGTLFIKAPSETQSLTLSSTSIQEKFVFSSTGHLVQLANSKSHFFVKLQ